MTMRLLPILVLIGCSAGCSEPLKDTSTDTSSQDTDTGSEDGLPLEGWGDITGDCGILNEQNVTGAASDLFGNTIDLAGEPENADLTDGGQEILSDGNAGGSSIYSEIFAFEVLARCEMAELVKTENEILYDDPNGKKTDLLVNVNGVHLGVSVTRAVGWPQDDPWSPEQARELLEDKFGDIQQSSANVSNANAWAKQILHVIAFSAEHADSVAQAYEYTLGTGLVKDTLLMVTVTDGEDGFLY
jgi:hypothetical protein